MDNRKITGLKFLSGSTLDASELNLIQDLIRKQILVSSTEGGIIVEDYDAENVQIFFTEMVVNYKQFIFSVPSQIKIFEKELYENPEKQLYLKIDVRDVYTSKPYYSQIEYEYLIEDASKKTTTNYIPIRNEIIKKDRPKINQYRHIAEIVEYFSIRVDYIGDTNSFKIVVKNGVCRIKNMFYTGIYEAFLEWDDFFKEDNYMILSLNDRTKLLEIDFIDDQTVLNPYNEVMLSKDIIYYLNMTPEAYESGSLVRPDLTMPLNIHQFVGSNGIVTKLEQKFSQQTKNTNIAVNAYSEVLQVQGRNFLTNNDTGDRIISDYKINPVATNNITVQNTISPLLTNQEFTDYLTKSFTLSSKSFMELDNPSSLYLIDSEYLVHMEKTVPLAISGPLNVLPQDLLVENDPVIMVSQDILGLENNIPTTANASLKYIYGSLGEVDIKEALNTQSYIIDIVPTYSKNMPLKPATMILGKVLSRNNCVISPKWYNNTYFNKFSCMGLETTNGYPEEYIYPKFHIEVKDHNSEYSDMPEGMPSLIKLSDGENITELYQSAYNYLKKDSRTFEILNLPEESVYKRKKNHLIDVEALLSQMVKFNDHKCHHIMVNFNSSYLISGSNFLVASDSSARAIRTWNSLAPEENIFNVEDESLLETDTLGTTFAPADLHRIGRCYIWNSDHQENFKETHENRESYLNFNNEGIKIWVCAKGENKDLSGNVISNVYGRFLLNESGIITLKSMITKPADVDTNLQNHYAPTTNFNQVILYEKSLSVDGGKLTEDEARSLLMGEIIQGSYSNSEVGYLYKKEGSPSIMNIVIRNGSTDMFEYGMNRIEFQFDIATCYSNYADIISYFFNKCGNFKREVSLIKVANSESTKQSLEYTNFSKTDFKYPIKIKKTLTNLKKDAEHSNYITYRYGICGVKSYEDVPEDEFIDIKMCGSNSGITFYDYADYTNYIDHPGVKFRMYKNTDKVLTFSGTVLESGYNNFILDDYEPTENVEIGLREVKVFEEDSLIDKKLYSVGPLLRTEEFVNEKKNNYGSRTFTVNENCVVKSLHLKIDESIFNKINVEGVILAEIFETVENKKICSGVACSSNLHERHYEIFFKEHVLLNSNFKYEIRLSTTNQSLSVDLKNSYLQTIKYNKDTETFKITYSNISIMNTLRNEALAVSPNVQNYLAIATPFVNITNIGEFNKRYHWTNVGNSYLEFDLNGDFNVSTILNLNHLLVLEGANPIDKVRLELLINVDWYNRTNQIAFNAYALAMTAKIERLVYDISNDNEKVLYSSKEAEITQAKVESEVLNPAEFEYGDFSFLALVTNTLQEFADTTNLKEAVKITLEYDLNNYRTDVEAPVTLKADRMKYGNVAFPPNKLSIVPYVIVVGALADSTPTVDLKSIG